ncbi:MAG: multicopper oxidase domain-containing protein [Anaerolineae bacterium]
MHTNIFTLPQRLSSTRRWLMALVIALAVTVAAVYSAHAANIPPVDCTTAHTTSFDLWAKSGTATMADGTIVNIWGYAANSGDAAQLPGPTLVACAGDNITINLHNVDIPSASSLAVHGQAGLAADMAGVTAGGSKGYAFTARAGTFVYQAGLTPDGPMQAAMGLYGALVVYPANGQAYSANSAFDAEQLVLMSEIDPALNGIAPAPVNTAFEMGDYAPKYWLINGKSYPQTDPISVTAGNRVLLRYANAGFEEHSMSLLGLNQSVIAMNGYLSPFAHGAVAETVPPGSTMDTLVTMPTGGQYPLYDGNQHIDTNGANALGGMMTFINVTAVAAPQPAVGVKTDIQVNPVPPSSDKNQPPAPVIVPPAQ